ncbi:DNA -binding domain-containing protein [Caulobacter hibisci]|uniref:DUF2285 domain-containing protein n=1 Tax=Caulobacter hibisci TaxID=2035993 RepID=A0ABS0T0H3_9CAUL|nr:DUF2285 domain-containing protein [Caulobacter hibisci]MBI1685184.1 DUF2285 domain-containing protein [Caulobacter hibisci]
MQSGDLRETPIGDPEVTDYDRAHLPDYLRLLDADAAHADWREAASVILGLDIAADPARAQRIHQVHLDRARWMSTCGYRQLVGTKPSK